MVQWCNSAVRKQKGVGHSYMSICAMVKCTNRKEGAKITVQWCNGAMVQWCNSAIRTLRSQKGVGHSYVSICAMVKCTNRKEGVKICTSRKEGVKLQCNGATVQ